MTDQTGPTSGPPTPDQPETPKTPETPETPAAGGAPTAAVPPAAAVPPPTAAVPPPVYPAPTAPTAPAASVPPPPPPSGYGQAMPPGAGGPAPATKGGAGRRIARIVGTIVVVSLLGIGWKAYQNHHATASAPEKGQCVQAQNESGSNPSVKKVDCSDSAAEFVVLDKIPGGSDSACDTVAGTEAVFLSTRGSTKLYALCLKRK